MAIWQFNIEFIPKQSLINIYGDIPAELRIDKEAMQNQFRNSAFDGDCDFEDALSIYWWLDVNLLADDLFLILSEFGKVPEWKRIYEGIKSFGNEDTNEMSMCYDENTRFVENISCRLDIRQMDEFFVDKMLSFAIQFDCLLMDRQGRLFKPTLNELSNAIKLSNASRFVSDPEQFLNDLSDGRINPE